MPILNRAAIKTPGTPEFDLFQGEFADNPQDWFGYLPPLDYAKWARIDPALDMGFSQVIESSVPVIHGTSGPVKISASMAQAMGGAYYSAFAQSMNGIKAARGVLGQVSITSGLVANQIPKLKNLFQGSLATSVTDKLQVVGKTIDTLDAILKNPILTSALDGLSGVPILGQILQGVKFVAKLIGTIINIMAKKREAEWDRIRASRALLPMVEWPPKADDMVMQTLLSRLRRYDATWVALPRYPALRASDFVARAAGADGRIAAWIVYGRGGYLRPSISQLEEEIDAGLGFVPGTTAIHGPMQLSTGYAKEGFDVGGYFPTAGQASATWWGNLLTDAPPLYSVRVNKMRDAWENYLRALLAYAQFHLSYSWSVSAEPKWGDTVPDDHPVAEGFEDPRHPGSWPLLEMDPYKPGYDRFIPGACRQIQLIAKLQGVKGPTCGDAFAPTHAEVVFKRLDELFGWSDTIRDWGAAKNDIASQVNFDMTTCGLELNRLEERQIDGLQGMLCCYVDTSTAILNGVRVPRFPAIYHSTRLKTLLQENRRAILNSDMWKAVRLEDVPGGPDDLPRELDPEDREFYNALVRKGARVGVVQAPLDAPPFEFSSLAAPQKPKDVPINANLEVPTRQVRKKSSNRSWLPALGIAGAAVASGYVVLRGRGKLPRLPKIPKLSSLPSKVARKHSKVLLGAAALGAAAVVSAPKKKASRVPNRASKPPLRSKPIPNRIPNRKS